MMDSSFVLSDTNVGVITSHSVLMENDRHNSRLYSSYGVRNLIIIVPVILCVHMLVCLVGETDL